MLPTQKNDEIEKNEQKRKAELKTVVKEHFPMVDTLHEPIAEPAFQTVCYYIIKFVLYVCS